MSFIESLIPKDPVDLAAGIAAQPSANSLDIMPSDEFTVAALDHAATIHNFIGTRYFVDAHTAFSLPPQLDQPYQQFSDGVSFEAVFVSYAKLHIGRIIGCGAVRAFCLSFSDGFVLNDISPIPSDHMLFVPILSVEEIQKSL